MAVYYHTYQGLISWRT